MSIPWLDELQPNIRILLELIPGGNLGSLPGGFRVAKALRNWKGVPTESAHWGGCRRGGAHPPVHVEDVLKIPYLRWVFPQTSGWILYHISQSIA